MCKAGSMGRLRTVGRVPVAGQFLIAAVLACVAAGSTPVAAQRGDGLTVMPKDSLELVKVLTAQERDWNNGNLDGFLAGYKHSAETTFVGQQVQHGWDQMAAHYRSSYPSKEAMGTLSFSDLEPRLLDDHFAVLTGRYNLERGRKFGGNASGVFSLVFEKTADAGWKIVLDHTG